MYTLNIHFLLKESRKEKGEKKNEEVRVIALEKSFPGNIHFVIL